VLTFKGIIEDTGADRGLLFSESGFQAGAIQAAQSTNITLTSLAGFEQGFPAEVSSARAKVLEERITALMQAFMAIWDLPEPERAAAFTRYSGPSGFLQLEGTPDAMTGVMAVSGRKSCGCDRISGPLCRSAGHRAIQGD
jgi:hypothetical protein